MKGAKQGHEGLSSSAREESQPALINMGGGSGSNGSMANPMNVSGASLMTPFGTNGGHQLLKSVYNHTVASLLPEEEPMTIKQVLLCEPSIHNKRMHGAKLTTNICRNLIWPLLITFWQDHKVFQNRYVRIMKGLQICIFLQRNKHSEATTPISPQYCKAAIKMARDQAVIFGREKVDGVCPWPGRTAVISL